MKIKIQRYTIFSHWCFACSVWNHEFKNTWITVFCRNHEYWCHRINVLSSVYIFNIILMFWKIWTLLEKSKHIILLLFVWNVLFSWKLESGKKEIEFKMSVSHCIYNVLHFYHYFDVLTNMDDTGKIKTYYSSSIYFGVILLNLKSGEERN